MHEMGVPQEVIDLQPKADPYCFNYVDHAQAEAWGLLSDREQLRAPHTAKSSPRLPKELRTEPQIAIGDTDLIKSAFVHFADPSRTSCDVREVP